MKVKQAFSGCVLHDGTDIDFLNQRLSLVLRCAAKKKWRVRTIIEGFRTTGDQLNGSQNAGIPTDYRHFAKEVNRG
jgi:hypothetical protein